jgi:hypothetical protein
MYVVKSQQQNTNRQLDSFNKQKIDLLQSKGIALPHLWKKFDNEWLSEKWRSY